MPILSQADNDLLNAIRSNNIPGVHNAVANGANVNCFTIAGSDPGMMGPPYQDYDMDGNPITVRDNWNQGYHTPLFLAVYYTDNPELINVLLSYGANASVLSYLGFTPWGMAFELNRVAGTHAASKVLFETATQMYLDALNSNNATLVLTALKQGADANLSGYYSAAFPIVDGIRRDPLYAAASLYDNPELLRTIITYGAAKYRPSGNEISNTILNAYQASVSKGFVGNIKMFETANQMLFLLMTSHR